MREDYCERFPERGGVFVLKTAFPMGNAKVKKTKIQEIKIIWHTIRAGRGGNRKR